LPFYAIEPIPAVEECYLIEAVYWIAVRRFPEVAWVITAPGEEEDVKPWRDGEDWLSQDPWDAYHQNFERFTDEECRAIGLDTREEAIKGSAESVLKRFDIDISDADLSYGFPRLIPGSLSSTRYKEVSDALNLETFPASCEWEERVDKAIASAEQALLEKLQSGNVPASAHPWPEPTIEIPRKYDDEEGWAHETLPYAKPREPIPAPLWKAENVDWQHNRLDCNWFVYRMVKVDTDSLMQAFPPSKDFTIKPNQEDPSQFVIQIPDSMKVPIRSKGAGGRPRKPEAKFFHEVIRRILSGDFNQDKQDAEVAYFEEWAVDNIPGGVSATWIKDRLSPIFQYISSKDEN